MKAIDRLYELLKIKGIKPTVFEKNIGLSSGYLSNQRKRNADMGETIISKIIDSFKDVNIAWLLTGKGEMFKSNETSSNNQSIKGNGNNMIGRDVSIAINDKNAMEPTSETDISQLTILDRLLIFMKENALNNNKITAQCNLSNGLLGNAFKSGNGLNSDTIEKLLRGYPELSASWLLTGRGSMLQSLETEVPRLDKKTESKDVIKLLLLELGQKNEEIGRLKEKIDYLSNNDRN